MKPIDKHLKLHCPNLNNVEVFKEAYIWGCKFLKIKASPRLKQYSDCKSTSVGAYLYEENLIKINVGHPFLAKNHSRLLETLFHELTHCKQYESGILKSGDLIHSRGTYHYFRKKGYVGYYEIYSFSSYWNALHEIQARKFQTYMLKKFFKHICLKNL